MHLRLPGACFLPRDCESFVPSVRPFATHVILGS